MHQAENGTRGAAAQFAFGAAHLQAIALESDRVELANALDEAAVMVRARA